MMARIEDAMREIGYEPTGIRAKAFKPVLVIVGDVAESFFANIIRGICDRVQETGYCAVVWNSGFQGDAEGEAIRMANAADYAGIIMVTAVESPSLVSLIRSIRCPLVFVNRYIRSLNMDEVCVDNYRGAYIATEHLLSKGHRHIAHLAGPDFSTATQDRLHGYRNAMQDAGIVVPDEFILYGDLSAASGYRLAPNIMDSAHRFTGVFVPNAQMSFGMLNAFYERGVRVPEDISVTCHDELPQIVDGPFRLTTVCYDPYPLGIEAVNVLLRRIASPQSERVRVFYAPHLTCRDSVAPPMRE